MARLVLVAAAAAILGAAALAGPDGTPPAGPPSPNVAERAALVDRAYGGDFQAIQYLAIAGYAEDAVEPLLRAVETVRFDETTRRYAAMGLRNFWPHMPKEKRAPILERLAKVATVQRGRTPYEACLILAESGRAEFVDEALGDELVGHMAEIAVIAALADPKAADRLCAIIERTPKTAVSGHYNRRSEAGLALVRRRDKRGIDALVALLPAEAAPGPLYRENVYRVLAGVLGRNFGYPGGLGEAELDKGAARMTAWWRAHRESFSFDKGRAKPAPDGPESKTGPALHTPGCGATMRIVQIV